MNSLKSVLMGSVAAISLAASPAIAQDTATQPSEQQQTGASERSYDSVYGDNFAGLGDRTIDELVGTELVNDAGESIGEIDNFGLAGDQIVAIVGIGGFLGMGEHMVAMPIERLSYDGEQLVISDVTREELEALPEYDESQTQAFASDQTFRSSYERAVARLRWLKWSRPRARPPISRWTTSSKRSPKPRLMPRRG